MVIVFSSLWFVQILKLMDIFNWKTDCSFLFFGLREILLPLIPDNGLKQKGMVQRKPGRGDTTLSVSCSDKIARWNAVGVQG